MPQVSHTTKEMLTIRSLMEKLMKTDTGKAGLVLVIAGIIGLIVVFAVSWVEVEDEGNKEDYKYGDFGDDFKDNVGGDLDDYLHGSARLSLIGFTALFLAGILLTLQAYNGKVYDILSPHLPSIIKSNPRHPEFLKILLAIILFVFTLMIIISGTHFIGFTNSLEEFAEGEGDSDFEMKSTAGWVVLIMGIVLMGLEWYYLYGNLNPEVEHDGNTYRQTITKYTSLMTLLCLVGLIVFSLFPMVTLNVSDENEDRDIKFNDGFVHWAAQLWEVGDDFEDIDSDLGWMRLFLWGGFFIGLITILGLAYSYYSGDDHSGRFHLTASLGTFILIFAILFLIFHALVFSHINDLDEENEDCEVDASFGPNYIPLLCGIGLIVLGVLYAKEVYPVSIQRIIGPKPPEAEGPKVSVETAKEGEEGNQNL